MAQIHFNRSRIFALCTQALVDNYALSVDECTQLSWVLEKFKVLFESELEEHAKFQFVSSDMIPQQPWIGQRLLRRGEESIVEILMKPKVAKEKLVSVKKDVNHRFLVECWKKDFPAVLKVTSKSQFVDGKLIIGLSGAGFNMVFTPSEDFGSTESHYDQLIRRSQRKANLPISEEGLMAYAALRQIRNQEDGWKPLTNWHLLVLAHDADRHHHRRQPGDANPDQGAGGDQGQGAEQPPPITGRIVLDVLMRLKEQRNIPDMGITWPVVDPVSRNHLVDAKSLDGLKSVAVKYFHNPTRTVARVLKPDQMQILYAAIQELYA